MKFILNKCKVIQLGKYNLTPWRLGERHLESSNAERPEGQQIASGFAVRYGGRRNRRLRTGCFRARLSRWKGRFSLLLPRRLLRVTPPSSAEQPGVRRSHHVCKTGEVRVRGSPVALWGHSRASDPQVRIQSPQRPLPHVHSPTPGSGYRAGGTPGTGAGDIS